MNIINQIGLDYEKIEFTPRKELLEKLGYNGAFYILRFAKLPEDVIKAVCKKWLEDHHDRYEKHSETIQEWINHLAVMEMIEFVEEAKSKFNANISPEHAMNHLINEGFSSNTAIEITTQAHTNGNGYLDFSMGWHK